MCLTIWLTPRNGMSLKTLSRILKMHTSTTAYVISGTPAKIQETELRSDEGCRGKPWKMVFREWHTWHTRGIGIFTTIHFLQVRHLNVRLSIPAAKLNLNLFAAVSWFYFSGVSSQRGNDHCGCGGGMHF